MKLLSSRRSSKTEARDGAELPRGSRDFRDIARDGLLLTAEKLGYRRYQPLYGLSSADQSLFPEPKRPVDERWQHIVSHLPSSGSAMDIGSQHGWITFKLAEHGLHAIGIEKSKPAFHLSQWLTVYNQSERASFMRVDISPDTVKQLPTVDVVVCMAIFHHWVRLQGLENAEAIMRALAERCRDRMFFETGQYDETDRDYEHLAFMGKPSRGWIEDFLQSLGFASVTHLGETLSLKNKQNRHLMLATR